MDNLQPNTDSADINLGQMTQFTVLDNAMWLLHGVDPITEKNFLHPESDSIWYINKFDDYLKTTITDQSSLQDIIYEGILLMSDIFGAEVSNELAYESQFLPAATISILRWNPIFDTLEYFTLGDSSIYLHTGGATIRLCSNDGWIHHRDYNPFDDWVLSFAPQAVQYARQGTVDFSTVDYAYICSHWLDYLFDSPEFSPDITDVMCLSESYSLTKLLDTVTQKYRESHDESLNELDVELAILELNPQKSINE